MGDSGEVRKGQTDTTLSEDEFKRRAKQRFADPVFEALKDDVDRVIDAAYDGYQNSRKAPHTHKAGPEFADPEYELSDEWRAAHRAIQDARKRHALRAAPDRVLLLCASARTDQTCPGEMSKSFRLAKAVQRNLEERNAYVDFLDLSKLTSEYGRIIYPCKGCVSTAMPLCHFPCSCYPNHSLGQTQDWMNELYPRFIEAHGLFIVTPVYWYQAPSTLKLLMDRLVCADGGNEDPTSTAGKDPQKAKAMEREGWSYPRHLAGRASAVAVHGDAAGTDVLERSLTAWLADMKLISAGSLSRYVGYYERYADSHHALDEDEALFEETRQLAVNLLDTVAALRGRQHPSQRHTMEEPRPK